MANYLCPTCNSPLRVWADLDAELSLEVKPNGRLVKQKIRNIVQSDGRGGVDCTECDWERNVNEMELDDKFVPLVEDALERQQSIDMLAAKRT